MSEALAPSEPKTISDEVAKLRDEVARLCQAVQSLVKLQSIANQKLDAALKGGADFAAIG
jgi:hypothetical protein